MCVIYQQESDWQGNLCRDSMDSHALVHVQQSNSVSAEGYKIVCGGERCTCSPSNRQRKISLLCGTSLVFDTLRGRDDSIVEMLLYHTWSLIQTACTANNTHVLICVTSFPEHQRKCSIFTRSIFRISRGCGLGMRLNSELPSQNRNMVTNLS